MEYTLGVEPAAGRGTPNPDLFPANNPVLRPPLAGKIGLWSKTDSTSYAEQNRAAILGHRDEDFAAPSTVILSICRDVQCLV